MRELAEVVRAHPWQMVGLAFLTGVNVALGGRARRAAMLSMLRFAGELTIHHAARVSSALFADPQELRPSYPRA